MSRPRLLVLGKRRGALLAAARLDAEVLLLDDGPRPARASGVRGGSRVDFSDLDGCVEAARKIVANRTIDAVVPVVERAVLAAAAVREGLKISGPTLAEAEPWRDKVVMKERIRSAGIPTAAFRALGPTPDADALMSALGLPIVLKPRASSGSRGTTVVRSRGELTSALSSLHQTHAGGWMAEAFVPGVEMSIESIVQDGAVRFENLTEYLVPGWANIVPAVLPPRIANAVTRLNRRAVAALGIRDGITHLEVFVRDEGSAEPTVVFGELAARPPGGMIMTLIELAHGFDPWRALFEAKLHRTLSSTEPPTASAGAWFLHPGEGQVISVGGVDEARAVAGVVSVEVMARPGDRVSRRIGVGEHKGRVLVRTPSRAETLVALTQARGLVRLAVDLAA